MTIIETYSNDGYSGTTFDRPDFQEMIEDITRKNCIIVKDLSRLGRNYLNVGNFTENILEKYKIRFISVNDNVDSFLKSDSTHTIEVYFKNLMNEGFAKDISKKVRTSFSISKKNGNYIGVVAPFGYIKDPEDNHKFIIDKDSSKIVKSIFRMALRGISRQEIIKNLNENHIATPSNYMKNFCEKKSSLIADKWNLKILDYLLKNENYTGNLIQGKRTRIGHKKHNLVKVPEDEWITIKNHHQPIIDEKVFNQVQSILYNRKSRINNNGKYYKYTGYLKCADCNSSMHKFKRPNSHNVFFYCGLYTKKKQCTKHYITEDDLDSIVLITINKFIELVSNLNEKISKNISISYYDYESENKQFRLIELEKEEQKYRKLLNDIKEDFKNDIISKEDLDLYKDKYMFLLNKVLLEKEELNTNPISNNLERIKEISKIGKIDFIDRSIINELIDSIIISEGNGVEIVFKYKNLYEDALRYLNN